MSILRRLFGASKAEVWQRLSKEIGATYVPGGLWKGARVVARRGQWTITLDTHSVSTRRSTMLFTRLRAPFGNPDRFRFTLYPQGMLSELGKWLGMQDVAVGDPQFDEQYVIQGNDPGKLKALLGSARVRELILAHSPLYLSIEDDEGWLSSRRTPGVDELRLQVVGVVTDVECLKALMDLFAVVLDELCRLDIGGHNAPEAR